ncbi:6434_t:CDS:2, partial [Funneliformis geosporum]
WYFSGKKKQVSAISLSFLPGKTQAKKSLTVVMVGLTDLCPASLANSFIGTRYYLPGGRNEVTRPPAPALTPAARQKA